MPIPWGMMGPDRAQLNAPVVLEAKNCIPGVSSFLPLPSPVPSTSALASTVRGAVSVLKDDGSVATYAGTQTKLYKLASDLTWTDVSRASGGDYNVGSGEQWKFDIYGDNLIGANVNAPFNDVYDLFLPAGAALAWEAPATITSLYVYGEGYVKGQ